MTFNVGVFIIELKVTQLTLVQCCSTVTIQRENVFLNDLSKRSPVLLIARSADCIAVVPGCSVEPDI